MSRLDDSDLDELHTDSLVGSYFHGDLDRQWQGRVVAQVAPHTFLVELFSWVTGGSTFQRLVEVEEMVDWRFYDDTEWMRNDYDYDLKHHWADANRAHKEELTAEERTAARARADSLIREVDMEAELEKLDGGA